MKITHEKISCGVIVATLILFGIIGYADYRLQRSIPGSASWTHAEEPALRQVASWPEVPRSLARIMVDRFGPPDRRSEEALSWLERGYWKRIVVHRLPSESSLEQVANYELPPQKIELVRALGHGIQVGPLRGELSAMSGLEGLNILALNLADEIARGLRAPDEAREFYVKTVNLAAAGKSSAYMEKLLFEPRRSATRNPAFLNLRSAL